MVERVRCAMHAGIARALYTPVHTQSPTPRSDVERAERVLNHVLPELPRGSDNADPAGGRDVIGVFGDGIGTTMSGALCGY